MSFKEKMIAAAHARRTAETIHCPTLGQDVGIRRLTSSEFQVIMKASRAIKDESDRGMDMQRRIISACIVDPETSEKAFSVDEVAMEFDQESTNELFQFCMDRNGLGKRDDDAKN